MYVCLHTHTHSCGCPLPVLFSLIAAKLVLSVMFGSTEQASANGHRGGIRPPAKVAHGFVL